MFKAHKHAFSALHNGLHRIAGPIHTANREAKKLKAHLERLQTVGEQVQSINEDVKSIWSWLAPAVAYSHALAQVKRLGLSPVEMRQAKNAAWRNTQAIPTSTAAENLRDFAVLRRRLGNTAAALRLLPIVERTKALTAAAPEGGGAFIGCDLPVLRQS
ncbi:MAG TPA: hypothetical protein DEP05_02730, partial [Betaproteobacteria bacterium]|nr:hypothetical protein [Betaproteobacteria bacterium]